MKIKKSVSFILGVILFLFGLLLIINKDIGGIVPLLVGVTLVYLGIKGTRTALIIFGHMLVTVGCGLAAWGIYLLAYSKPIFLHIIFRPFFWELFSVFGGICAIYHGFCQCVRCPKNQ